MTRQILISVAALAVVCIIGVVYYQNQPSKSNDGFRSFLNERRRLDAASDGSSSSSLGSNKKPIAVLHIGPHKTGTTTLQSFIQTNHRIITADGYYMPWTLKPPPHGAGEFGIASCFLTGKRKEKFQAYRPLCKNNGEELSTLKELGKQGKNVLLSAESFSFITDIGALAEALEPWDVKVIYFHRWYHDWLLSNFNQASNSKLNRILANFDKFIADAGSGAAKQKAKYNSLVNNFEKFYEEDFSMPDESYRSFYRYREHFDNVVALDYEDTRISLTEKFFCRGLKNETTGTCAEFLRQKESSGAGSTRINGAKTLAYKNIAYGANLLGVTSFCSKGHYDDVVAKIQHHHETTLGRSNTEFPTNCLKNVILEKLIEVSIEHRRNILPDVPFTEAEEKRIRSEFWSKMTEEKRGCDFDIAGVLALPEWKSFFSGLERDVSCSGSKQ